MGKVQIIIGDINVKKLDELYSHSDKKIVVVHREDKACYVLIEINNKYCVLDMCSFSVNAEPMKTYNEVRDWLKEKLGFGYEAYIVDKKMTEFIDFFTS